MSGKTLATVVLLAFVAVSVGYLILGETSPHPPADTNAVAQTATTDDTAGRDQVADGPADNDASAKADTADLVERDKVTAPEHRVIAYYFHNTQRCRTCLKIERLAEEALRERFTEDLTRGALEWRAVNMEEAANEHFVQEYQLVASSLVLVDVHDGKQRDWTHMEKVWQYVHKDEPAFKEYVARQASEYLERPE